MARPFGWMIPVVLSAIFRAFAGAISEFTRRAGEKIADVWSIAWPPPTAAIPLAELPATPEAIFAGRQRSRAAAYETRRLQRDPMDLSAGCGLRLAA